MYELYVYRYFAGVLNVWKKLQKNTVFKYNTSTNKTLVVKTILLRINVFVAEWKNKKIIQYFKYM